MTSLPRDAARAAAVVGVALVLGVTLYPENQPSVPGGCLTCSATWVADAIANVALFLPLGAALVAMGLRRRSALLAGAVLSAAVELLQAAVIPGRQGSVADIGANAAGAVLGALVASHASAILRPRHPRAAAAAAILAVTGVLVMTGAAARPSLPDSVWWGQWTPRFQRFDAYDGRVTMATIAGRQLPSFRLEDAAGVRLALERGDTLTVQAVAGGRTRRPAPIFSIADEDRRTILMLAAVGDDLGLRLRRVAGDLRLIQPRVMVPGALGAVAPGAAFTLSLWRRGPAWCVAVDGAHSCAVGMSIAGGWALLLGRGSRPWLAALADALWVAGLLAAAAFWPSGPFARLAGGAMLVLTCGVLPSLLGVDASSVAAWVGGAAGVVSGILARRKADAARPAAPGVT